MRPHQKIIGHGPSSLSGLIMRLFKKRKMMCLLLLGAAMVSTLMIAQTTTMSIFNSISIEAGNAELRQFIQPYDDGPFSSQFMYMEPAIPKPATGKPTKPVIKCSPVHNIAFVKTHKAGSSTVANILQRYGVQHDLNFALPSRKQHTPGYNYITKPKERLSMKKIIPLPPGQEYNILFHHSIYNRTAFHEIMPGNTTYITILREPFSQFVSAFEYYGMAGVFGTYQTDIVQAVNPLSTYLASPEKYDYGTTNFSYVRNKQAQDLGFSKHELWDDRKLHEYIAQMDKDFRLVMIMEYFDESLLMLKKELCWETIDILYIPQNANKHKPKRNFTEVDHQRHQKIDHIDYALYSHYSKIFELKLQQQDPDFFEELADFKKLLSQVKEDCFTRSHSFVNETTWYKSFQVTDSDCMLMLIPELSGLDYLLDRGASMRIPVPVNDTHQDY